MIKTVYFTLGELTDPAGTGLSLAVYHKDTEADEWLGVLRTQDGTPFLGYMPNEISEAEYLVWKERIRNPDMVTYFPGIFPGIGVVARATYVSSVDKYGEIVLAEVTKESLKAAKRLARLDQAALKLGLTSTEVAELLDVDKAELMVKKNRKANNGNPGNKVKG